MIVAADLKDDPILWDVEPQSLKCVLLAMAVIFLFTYQPWKCQRSLIFFMHFVLWTMTSLWLDKVMVGIRRYYYLVISMDSFLSSWQTCLDWDFVYHNSIGALWTLSVLYIVLSIVFLIINHIGVVVTSTIWITY